MRTDTDVEQGDLYGSVWPARRLPQATECGVKLEEQYAGYTASIGLTTPSLPSRWSRLRRSSTAIRRSIWQLHYSTRSANSESRKEEIRDG
jgi:hypothetical protein